MSPYRDRQYVECAMYRNKVMQMHSVQSSNMLIDLSNLNEGERESEETEYRNERQIWMWSETETKVIV